MTPDEAKEIKGANELLTAFATRMRALAAIACDTTRDKEARLSALMMIDAAFWRRRRERTDATIGERDKIAATKHVTSTRRLLRLKAIAVARGGRVHKVIGTMHLAEPADGLRCVVCHQPIAASVKGRERQTCGGACRMALYRARQAAA